MRFERKYFVGDFSLDLAHEAIRQHPASFRKIFPDRKVNNIYFDTPSFTAYRENVLGSPERKKIRIRWYGENTAEVQTPRLEIKIKKNELGSKQVSRLHAFDVNDRAAYLNMLKSELPWMAALQPVLLNAYRRSYYGTSDGKFRITVDSELQYCSLLNSFLFRGFQASDPAVILELKYDEKEESSSDRIRQYLPFRQTKSSKYVKGVSLTV